MKRIGITQRVVINRRYGERRDALDQRWPEFLARAGLAALPLPNRPELAVALAEEFKIEGLLFTGGNDLAEYGGDAPERDQTEAALLAWARAKSRPVAGVCRGMQVIQHGFGVKLERVAGHVTPAHAVTIDGAAREVNSYHGFAARSTVPELEVWARAGDGVVEALRHVREPIVGVMWHPERAAPFSESDVELFRSFFGVRA